MNIIYTRTSNKRKKDFQIMTAIYECSGKKYVIKRALHECGKNHIKCTYLNEAIVGELDNSLIAESTFDNSAIVTPYVKGITMSTLLRDSIIKADFNSVVKYFKQLKKIIIGKEENLVGFALTDQFQEIFGKIDLLDGDNAVKVSNLDCTFENIIYTENGEIKVVDLEWVFEMIVPIEYIYFYAIESFYRRNAGLIKWDLLMNLADLNVEKIRIYFRMEQKFYDYISIDFENKIDYRLIGNDFKINRVINNYQKYTYKFPLNLNENLKIIIYGAGKVGTDYYNYLIEEQYENVVGWADKKAEELRKSGLNVIDASQIKNLDYDVVLISVSKEFLATDIKVELIEAGVEESKIVWIIPIVY